MTKNPQFRTLFALSILAAAAAYSCSSENQDAGPSSGGSSGTAPDADAGKPSKGGSHGGVFAGLAGIVDAAESAGSAGEGGTAGGGGEGPGGQGGAEEGGSAGSAGSAQVEENCELPEYLKDGHIVTSSAGKPTVTDLVPTTDSGTVPYGTLVRYVNKFPTWRCDHKPFCNYAVKRPSLVPLPETERYWEPVYWQGLPPDGTDGWWVSPCTVEQWSPHGSCGGFYLGEDFVPFKDPTDLYSERFMWQCRDGWEKICDTQQPGIGYAWANVSSSFQCYGY